VLIIDSLRQRSVCTVKARSVADKESRTLTSLADMQEIPLSDQVYPDCQLEIAVVIILLSAGSWECDTRLIWR